MKCSRKVTNPARLFWVIVTHATLEVNTLLHVAAAKLRNRTMLEFRQFKLIGIIHAPFTTPEGMPIQPAGVAGIPGTVEVCEEYQAGLRTSTISHTLSCSIGLPVIRLDRIEVSSSTSAKRTSWTARRCSTSKLTYRLSTPRLMSVANG